LDQENQTGAIFVELTEGRQYRWGKIEVIGLDPKVETLLRSQLKAGSLVNPKLIDDFYRDNKSLLPVGVSPQSVKWQRHPERATLDLTFDFRTPAYRQFTIRVGFRERFLQLNSQCLVSAEIGKADFKFPIRLTRSWRVAQIISFAVCCPSKQIALAGGRMNDSGIAGSRA
jgi:hypothetical protein